MDDPLCRVSIQCADGPLTVDLALPRQAPLALLLPDIVALVIGDRPPSDKTVQGWRLDRLCGGRWDESMSLQESGITDGDVMVISALTGPAPGPLPEDAFHTVSGTGVTSEPTDPVPAGGWACAGAVAAAALGYSGTVGGMAIVSVATALAGAAACLAVAVRSVAPAARLTAQALAVGFVCVAGFLAVPDAPGIAGASLGAAAGCAASVWLLRSINTDTSFFTAAATALGLVTGVAVPSLIWSADLAAVGAALGVLSLGMLTGAARVAMALKGLRPAFPGQPALRVSEDSAIGSRDVFTGLVAGSAVATALAVGTIAVGSLGAPSWTAGFALASVMSALLVLRARLYADARCRRVPGWCGLAGAAAAAALATLSAPRYAGSAAMLAVALAAWSGAGQGGRGPAWSRAVDVLEYLLIAAVVPLACWVAGLYEVVRSMSVG